LLGWSPQLPAASASSRAHTAEAQKTCSGVRGVLRQLRGETEGTRGGRGPRDEEEGTEDGRARLDERAPSCEASRLSKGVSELHRFSPHAVAEAVGGSGGQAVSLGQGVVIRSLGLARGVMLSHHEEARESTGDEALGAEKPATGDAPQGVGVAGSRRPVRSSFCHCLDEQFHRPNTLSEPRQSF